VTPRFFDASALLKLYLNEKGSPYVLDIIQTSRPIVSGLTFYECSSAMARATLSQPKKLTQAESMEMRTRFAKDFSAMIQIRLGDMVASWSHQLLAKYPLRAGDIIQLSSAVLAQDRVQHRLEFVTFDEELWLAAQEHGFTPLPPDLSIWK